MDKRRYRSYFDDGLFVVLVMAAAMASAAMEASAVLGAMAKAETTQLRKHSLAASAPALPQAAAAASDQGAGASVARAHAAYVAER
jgi:hypothetical protein